MIIYKYPIERTGVNEIKMHAVHKILHFGEQARNLFVWAAVDKTAIEVRQILVVGTGQEVVDDGGRVGHYIGTVQTESGLVFHAFDLGEK